MFGQDTHRCVYGEDDEGNHASRMIHNCHFKLIFYPAGEIAVSCLTSMTIRAIIPDLYSHPDRQYQLVSMKASLVDELHGMDPNWPVDGELKGRPDRMFSPGVNRTLYVQGGKHWSLPPTSGKTDMVWYLEKEKGYSIAAEKIDRERQRQGCRNRCH